MQQIVSSREMLAFEEAAMRTEGIDALALMERAAAGVAACVRRGLPEGGRVCILAGAGSNGGDGLAVLRLLHGANVPAYALLAGDTERMHVNAARQLRLAERRVCDVREFTSAEQLQGADVIVDALFGTGLDRPVAGRFLAAIEAINASPARVVSVDIPSGVSADTGCVLGAAVRADETVTFQFAKRGHVLYPGKTLSGTLLIHSISDMCYASAGTAGLLDESDVAQLLPPRPADSHKGKNGRAVLFVGSARYTGAALLSAGAALRAGAGILTAVVPGAVKPSFARLPEAICLAANAGGAWDGEALLFAAGQLAGAQAAGLGCGMDNMEDGTLLRAALESRIPLVVDADGLNSLAREPGLQALLHARVILTPHPGEMARLLQCEPDAVLSDPIAVAQRAAIQFGCTVLLKGATSCIAAGNRCCLNASGNAGLAKGGSGDVLTGILTALLAQGLAPFDAACAGAYLLGASATEAFRLLGTRMLIARDVVDAVEKTVGETAQP